MPISDYAHHNEEAHAIWWAEEGRHEPEDRYDADADWRDEPETEEDEA